MKTHYITIRQKCEVHDVTIISGKYNLNITSHYVHNVINPP